MDEVVSTAQLRPPPIGGLNAAQAAVVVRNSAAGALA